MRVAIIQSIAVGCILLGSLLLVLAFTWSSREIRFRLRHLLFEGRHISESSIPERLQLALQGILGIALGALLLKTF
jgi:hypothetical protein